MVANRAAIVPGLLVCLQGIASLVFDMTQLHAFRIFRRSGQQHSKWHVIVSIAVPGSIARDGSKCDRATDRSTSPDPSASRL